MAFVTHFFRKEFPVKEKVIDIAGRAWRTLGERGESEIVELAKILREREDLVNQAVGWLAREDKIHYTNKRNKTVISLVESELQSFKKLSTVARPSGAEAVDQASSRKRKI